MMNIWILCVLKLIAATHAFPQSHRIVGGDPVAEGEFPWQLSIQLFYSNSWHHICGGALIRDNWVLTAAHCTDGWSPSSLQVQGGSTTLMSGDTAGVLRVVQHPQYGGSAPGLPNDIALIELSSPFPPSSNIQAISLPGSQFDSFEMLPNCWITGWGKEIGNASDFSQVLRKAEIPNIPVSECRTRWSGVSYATVLDNHLCVYEEGKSTCQGDWGSPYTCMIDGAAVLAGVTSWGHNTCSGEYPSMFTRVAAYLDWMANYL